jgi:bifunctional DNA-binding transcriptional regulator/antitoxin component of YhaV-PrlF toxin-antitoxin module
MKTYKFTARIESGGGGGAYVLFPHDVEVEFGTKGRVPVKATFDGVSYTGTMIRYGNPLHMLPILKAIREQIGKQPGDLVDVEVRRDAGERVLEVPEDLAKLLKKEKLSAIFEKLSYTNRREYCRWIADAKREETRARRLGKVTEMLRTGIKTPY